MRLNSQVFHRVESSVLQPFDPHVILIFARDQSNIDAGIDQLHDGGDQLHMSRVARVLSRRNRVNVLRLHVEAVLGTIDQSKDGLAIVIGRQERLHGNVAGDGAAERRFAACAGGSWRPPVADKMFVA
jgi:hypothetical protein